MKKYLLFVACLLFASPAVLAQLTGCGISFFYDAAGNRVERSICLTGLELRYGNQVTEEQLSQSLDLEGMLEEAGFSTSMEAEIEQLEALLSQPTALDLQAKSEENKPTALTQQNFQNLSDLLVFPNPTMESFSIRSADLPAEATLSIVDVNGRILSQRALGDGSGIDVSNLVAGTYLVTLVHQNERKIALLVKSDRP
ncbi:MAG: T9SS type A sorting domain-containing protein [Bacteroidota bacterium]